MVALLTFDGTQGHPRNKVALEEQEENQDGQRPQHAHRHHLIPFEGMLPHQQLDANRHGSHVGRFRQREREQEFVPCQHERVDTDGNNAR